MISHLNSGRLPHELQMQAPSRVARRPQYGRWGLFAVISLCGLIPALDPTTGHAQTFTYAHPSGDVTFPLVFGSVAQTTQLLFSTSTNREFPDDIFGNEHNPPPLPFPPTQIRIAANLNQRYRVIGNPFMFFPHLRFTAFSMNNTAGETADRVYFDQFYASSPASWTGGHSAGTSLAPASLASNISMTWPGFVMRVSTGPDRVRTVPALTDAESWGFQTDAIVVTPSATIHDQWLPTFAPYEAVIGVLNANDDVVRGALVANPDYTITVATWNVPPNDPAWGMAVWAKCGMDPGPGSFDVGGIVRSHSSAFLELGPCPSQWRIAWTNVTGSPVVFRATFGNHYATEARDRSGIRVGIDFETTADERFAIREAFREGAWRLYGMSGGTQILRSFRFYWLSNQCGGWPGCDYTVHNSSGISNCQNLPGIVLYGGASIDGYLVAHEAGHCFMGLGDEYERDSTGASIPECLHSNMGINMMTFCTAATHRRTAADYESSQRVSIRGPTSYGVDGSGRTLPATTSIWEGLYNNWTAPLAFPSDATPDSYSYPNFYESSAIGSFELAYY